MCGEYSSSPLCQAQCTCSLMSQTLQVNWPFVRICDNMQTERTLPVPVLQVQHAYVNGRLPSGVWFMRLCSVRTYVCTYCLDPFIHTVGCTYTVACIAVFYVRTCHYYTHYCYVLLCVCILSSTPPAGTNTRQTTSLTKFPCSKRSLTVTCAGSDTTRCP